MLYQLLADKRRHIRMGEDIGQRPVQVLLRRLCRRQNSPIEQGVGASVVRDVERHHAAVPVRLARAGREALRTAGGFGSPAGKWAGKSLNGGLIVCRNDVSADIELWSSIVVQQLSAEREQLPQFTCIVFVGYRA